MKVILWMTMSLNGIIARENNEEDFISDDSWREWIKRIRKAGCVIWGRKTHEVVKTWDKKYIDAVKAVRAIVITSDKNYEPGDGFSKVGSPKEALDLLKKEGFDEIILTGGSTLNSSFAKEALIDEALINIEPVIIGKGIPIFSPDNFDLNLKLLEIKKLGRKMVQLHYKVIKPTTLRVE